MRVDAEVHAKHEPLAVACTDTASTYIVDVRATVSVLSSMVVLGVSDDV